MNHDDRIDKNLDRTDKVTLTCVNHPHLRWMTKNIDGIGARTIFFTGDASRPGYKAWPVGSSISTYSDDFQHEVMVTQGYVFECTCPGKDLRLVPAPPRKKPWYEIKVGTQPAYHVHTRPRFDTSDEFFAWAEKDMKRQRKVDDRNDLRAASTGMRRGRFDLYTLNNFIRRARRNNA